MTDGNVISFDADELRARNMILSPEEEPEIELPIALVSEKKLGPLDELGRSLFIAKTVLEDELLDADREHQARIAEFQVEVFRTGKVYTDMNEYVKDLNSRIFKSTEEAEDYFEKCSRVVLIRAYFDYHIRQMYGHSYVLGIRKDYLVVQVAPKFIEPPAEKVVSIRPVQPAPVSGSPSSS